MSTNYYEDSEGNLKGKCDEHGTFDDNENGCPDCYEEKENQAYNDYRGPCPNCRINLTSNDMPYGKLCPYCKGKLPFIASGD